MLGEVGHGERTTKDGGQENITGTAYKCAVGDCLHQFAILQVTWETSRGRTLSPIRMLCAKITHSLWFALREASSMTSTQPLAGEICSIPIS